MKCFFCNNICIKHKTILYTCDYCCTYRYKIIYSDKLKYFVIYNDNVTYVKYFSTTNSCVIYPTNNNAISFSITLNEFSSLNDFLYYNEKKIKLNYLQ